MRRFTCIVAFGLIGAVLLWPAGGSAGTGVGDDDGDGIPNESDDCPSIPASPPNGCPDISRSVTLSYSNATHTVKGKVKSGLSNVVAAFGEVEYALMRKRSGEDKPIINNFTDSTGRYHEHKNLKPGRYYTRIEAETIHDVGNCSEAQSDILKI